MLNIVFWNVGGKLIQEKLATLADQYSVDIFFLAESRLDTNSVLDALAAKSNRPYYADPGHSGWIQVFSHFGETILSPFADIGRIAIRRFLPPGSNDILIICVHLESKLHRPSDDQGFGCRNLIKVIEDAERQVGHDRSIVIGDFNMNPFEKGIVMADALHAVCDREIARNRSCTVSRKAYKYFYNPMWNHFGDRPGRPPGTYYYNAAQPTNYYWNIFDQVLVRPDLIDDFQPDRIKIITEVGGRSLLTRKGRPDKRVGSDHLPLFISINV